MGKKIKPIDQCRNGYNNALDILQSAEAWKHAEAANKIVHLRKTYANLIGSIHDFEEGLLDARGLNHDFIDKAIGKANVVESVLAFKPKSSHELWQEKEKSEALMWLSKSADISHWCYGTQGIDNVIKVCRYTSGLVDYGDHLQFTLSSAIYDEKGTLYELSITGIDDDKAETVAKWQIGFNMMLNLISQAEEICAKQHIKSPFPKFND